MTADIAKVESCVDALFELLTLKMSVTQGHISASDAEFMSAGEDAAADLLGHDIDMIVCAALVVLESVFMAASAGSGIPALRLLAEYSADMRAETGRYRLTWREEGEG